MCHTRWLRLCNVLCSWHSCERHRDIYLLSLVSGSQIFRILREYPPGHSPLRCHPGSCSVWGQTRAWRHRIQQSYLLRIPSLSVKNIDFIGKSKSVKICDGRYILTPSIGSIIFQRRLLLSIEFPSHRRDAREVQLSFRDEVSWKLRLGEDSRNR